jgi:hypothetical protein
MNIKFPKLNIAFLIISGLTLATNVDAQKDTMNILAQFLFPEFSNGIVKFKNGSSKSADLNYNIISEKMVFRQNNKLFDMIGTETVDTVYLQDRKFIPQKDIFLEVIHGTPLTFYIQHRGNLMSPGKPAAYGGTSQTTASTSVTSINTASGTYNLKLPDDFTVKYSPVNWVLVDWRMEKFVNERQFIKIFPDREVVFKKFFKENKINMSKRVDLIKLMTFCNSLINS